MYFLYLCKQHPVIYNIPFCQPDTHSITPTKYSYLRFALIWSEEWGLEQETNLIEFGYYSTIIVISVLDNL